MENKLELFYLNQPEPIQSCFLALKDVILKYDLEHTLKYGSACFTHKGKHFCYLWKDKKTNEPYILIVDGNKIEHPSLIQGDRKRMKILPIDPNKDIPVDTIREVFELLFGIY